MIAVSISAYAALNVRVKTSRNSAPHLMEAILNSSGDLDTRLFDNVVKTFYTGTGYEREVAQQILTRFQNHADSWQRVPKILEESSVPETKYLGLQILERLIQSRWKSIPESQRIGIRHFVMGIITKATAEGPGMRKDRPFVNKLNLILVQILKREWPHTWPTFISELVQSSKINATICENNMAILKLLSEEIFDFSADQLVQAKINELKNSMCGEFSQIFQLCLDVLEKEQKISLIQITLETLLQFLNWIPLTYIFETSLIDMLLTRFLETSEFRNPTLRCLSEIAAFNIGSEYDPKFVILFAMVMAAVNRMLPPNTDIAEVYKDSRNDDQDFILNLSLFLTNFLSNHLRILETSRSKDVLLNAHLYLIKISQVEEQEIFKINLEYWVNFVAEMHGEMQNASVDAAVRRDIYVDVLSNVRLVIIERMVRPEEVLIFENEEGEMVRESLKDGDTATLYKSMREVLVYLTHLDVDDTEDILTEKMLQQVDGSEWSWNKLNTLCWAIGSISGAMSEETEGRFLIAVIKDLLGLCETKQGQDDKAAIASNIMYIVGQYPRFLRAHWRFLKVVVNKLFEFMHEPHKGVQDMACDTFIKIAQKCKRQFIIQQSEESEPFVGHIISSLGEITVDLAPKQVHAVYEAIGYMLSMQTDKSTKEKLIAHLMEHPNRAWDTLIAQAGSVDILDSINDLEAISNILKTNTAVCTSTGSSYISQLGRIYLDMLGLYRACGGIINQPPWRAGLSAARTPQFRLLQTIRDEVLKLVDVFIKKADDLDAISDSLVPPLLDSVLGDYASNSGASEPRVLDLLITLISILESRFSPHIGAIMDSIIETTLCMINNNFTEFPEQRASFYRLLRAINLHCSNALPSFQSKQLKLVMDSILWGMKHSLRDISDLALTICYEVIENLSNQDPAVAREFYGRFLLQILRDTFGVITDANHKSGFRLQSQLLAKVFELVQTGRVSIPLFDPVLVPDPNITNLEFLDDYCLNLIQNAFPDLQTHQTRTLLTTLFQYYNDLPRFKSALRDFLVQLREFSGDNADLYLEEREKESQKGAQERLEVAMWIPGMVKPNQLEDNEDHHDIYVSGS